MAQGIQKQIRIFPTIEPEGHLIQVSRKMLRADSVHVPSWPALILKPAMAAAIDVQKHARQRTARSSFAMHPAFPSPLYHPGSLQGQLPPGVAELTWCSSRKLLEMKMRTSASKLPLAIQSQDLLHLGPGALVSAREVPRCGSNTRHSQTLVAFPANDACAGR